MFQIQVDIESLAELSDPTAITDEVAPVTAWPNIVLTYNYNPVPEPIGAGLYMLLVVPLVMSRRSNCSR